MSNLRTLVTGIICLLSLKSFSQGGPPNPTCNISGVTVVNQTNCSSPDGSMTVSGVSPGNINNYTFVWYTGNSTSSGDIIGAGLSLSNLVAGDYTVVGINGNTGCVTPGFLVTILDETVGPAVTFTVTANTSCDVTNFPDGSATITATTASGPGAGANYNFSWISFPGESPGDLTNQASPQTFSSLAPGDYEVEVKNFVNECSDLLQFTISDQPDIPTIDAATVVDQEYCMPSGSIEVTALSIGLVSDYTFEWFEGMDNLLNNIPIAGVSGILHAFRQY